MPTLRQLQQRRQAPGITVEDIPRVPSAPGQPVSSPIVTATTTGGEPITIAAPLKEPTSQTFKDVRGKEVTLKETDIRPYIFSPELIQLEQDIARVKGIPGATTGIEAAERMEEAPADVREAEAKRVAEASARLEGRFAPPGTKPSEEIKMLTSADEASQFEKFLIDQQFGGQDPRTMDPYAIVDQQATERNIEASYDSQRLSGDPLWQDLDPKMQKAWQSQYKANLFDQVTNQIKMSQDILNEQMNQYHRERKAREQQFEKIQKQTEKQLKEIRSLREKKQKTRSADLKTIATANANIAKLMSQLTEAAYSGNPEQIESIQNAIAAEKARVAEARTRIQASKETETKPGTEQAPIKTAGKAEASAAGGPAKAKPPWAPEGATRWIEREDGKFYELNGQYYKATE